MNLNWKIFQMIKNNDKNTPSAEDILDQINDIDRT